MQKIRNIIERNPLILICTILASLSCFAILNAAPLMSKIDNPNSLWIKQLVFYAISAVVIFIIIKVGKDQVYNNIHIIYWGIMILLVGLAVEHFVYTRFAMHIVPFASHVSGATSWYNLPGFSLQPSEFMKIAIVIYLAKITSVYNAETTYPTLEGEIRYILKCIGVMLLPTILVFLQNDTGVVLIMFAGVVCVMFSSALRTRWFSIGVLAVLTLVGIFVFLFVFQPELFSKFFPDHQMSRFYGWIDPEGTINNEGYQLFYSLLSYGTAGWFGHGFQSVIKVFPEAQTDFIFAVITTNYGYLGGFLTIGLVVVLDIYILKIGFDSTNRIDKSLACGIFGMLFFQQVWNISMILGLLPITGITLPFISYGGSSLLSYMIAIGLFMDINYQNNIRNSKRRYY